LAYNDLSSWEFSGQNLAGADLIHADLTEANFLLATLTNADLSFADARGAIGLNATDGAKLRNTILPDGRVDNLNLADGGDRLTANAGVQIPVKMTGNFSIVPGAQFDLTDNAAIVNYTGVSPVATVREKILSARGGPGLGGAWTGTGITSSTTAAANQTVPDSRSLGYTENASLPLGAYTTFHGAAVDNTSVLIAYTRTGDANLDGVVNDDDITIVGATYAPGVQQASWALGDFDYNGFVDDDDVTLLGAFYDPSAPPLAVLPVGSSASVIAVPEPGTLTLAALAGLLFIASALLRPRCRRAIRNIMALRHIARWPTRYRQLEPC
jgi:hypothetical protein